MAEPGIWVKNVEVNSSLRRAIWKKASHLEMCFDVASLIRRSSASKTRQQLRQPWRVSKLPTCPALCVNGILTWRFGQNRRDDTYGFMCAAGLCERVCPAAACVACWRGPRERCWPSPRVAMRGGVQERPGARGGGRLGKIEEMTRAALCVLRACARGFVLRWPVGRARGSGAAGVQAKP